jgi:hypothetical protein
VPLSSLYYLDVYAFYIIVDDDIVVDKTVLRSNLSEKCRSASKEQKMSKFLSLFQFIFSFPLYFDEKIMNEGQHYKQFYPF